MLQFASQAVSNVSHSSAVETKPTHLLLDAASQQAEEDAAAENTAHSEEKGTGTADKSPWVSTFMDRLTLFVGKLRDLSANSFARATREYMHCRDIEPGVSCLLPVVGGSGFDVTIVWVQFSQEGDAELPGEQEL